MRTKKIYSLVDPRDGAIRYVGASYTPERRIYSPKTENNGKYEWLLELRKIGLFPIVRIMEQVEDKNWAERERWWIAELSNTCDLFNIRAGGGGGGPGSPGIKRSDETRAKMSASQLGKPKNLSPEGREALREKGGENSRRFWTDPTPEQLEAIAAGRERGWARISPEERSRRASERSKAMWASYSDEEKEARKRGLRNLTPEERSERARKAALAGIRKRADDKT